MPLTYRSVKGSKLTSAEADGNITNLDGRITNLEDNPPEPRSIDSTSAAGEVMTITYTDATTDTVNLPKVEYHDRGAWSPLTLYAKYDTFPEEGTLYEVLYPHTSAATFDPGANDGMGHDYYRGIFSNPDNLTDLADVTITSPSIGAGLVWNGSAWVDGVPVTDAAGVTYFASTDGSLASTTVLTAIEELEGRVSEVASEVSGLTADLSGLNALDIAFTPTTDSALTSGNVSSALEEIEAEMLLKAANLSDIPNTTTARTNLGLAIGTDVQGYDADLAALAANSTSGLWAHTGAGTGAARTITQGNGISVTNGDGVSGDPTIAQTANAQIDTVEFVIDGGGSTITTGMKGYIEVPFACTITRATLLADQSGSIVVDVFKCTYAQFDAGSTHPVSGDKITASAPPTITTATKAQDSTLTGWTTAISAGDILAFNVNSVTAVQRATISLKVTHI